MIEGTTSRRTGRQDGMNGVLVAGITAVISGISVFANSYGVHHVPSPSVYTTGKNLVAFVALGAATLAASAWRRRSTARGEMAARWVAAPEPIVPGTPSTLTWVGLAYVGVIGGGLAFVLFFNGLARTTATPAAFLHDTLVIWVVLSGCPLSPRASGQVEHRRHSSSRRGRSGAVEGDRPSGLGERYLPRPGGHFVVGGRGGGGQEAALRYRSGPRFRWSAWEWDPWPCSPTWRSRAVSLRCSPSIAASWVGSCSPGCCSPVTSAHG